MTNNGEDKDGEFETNAGDQREDVWFCEAEFSSCSALKSRSIRIRLDDGGDGDDDGDDKDIKHKDDDDDEWMSVRTWGNRLDNRLICNDTLIVFARIFDFALKNTSHKRMSSKDHFWFKLPKDTF